MSFPAYTSYRDSGVAWLGEVPTDWRVTRTRFLCAIETGDADTADAEPDAAIPFFVRSQTVERISKHSHECEAVLTAGDGVGVGKVFHHFEGKFRAHQRVYIFREFDLVSGRYFYYFLSGFLSRVVSEGTAKSTVDSLRRPMLADFPVAFPDIKDQHRITDFLDRETSKIDKLAETQRTLISLLREKRRAVISQAVTAGIDHGCPTQGSGFDWLGEVPKGWEVTSLKRFCHKITDGAHISPETENGTQPFVSTKDLSDKGIDFENCLRTSESSYDYLVKTGCQPIDGDILFSKDGTIGRTVVVRDSPDFVIASSLIIIRPNSQLLHAEYLHYLCQSSFFMAQVDTFVKGAGLPRLSIQNLLRIIGIFPPIEEQKKIAQHLSKSLKKFDDMMAEAYLAVALLQERRAALITAAITGRIDVRERAKVLTFPIDRARARGLVAAEIIERSAHQPAFGRVKFQKIAFLAEAHVGISGLAGSYTREAAGPLDRALITEMESGARSIAGVVVDQAGGTGTTVSYRLGPQRGAHRQELANWLGTDRTAKLDKLIADFADLTTKGAEAVATLYGVWNDALIEGASPTDDEIISGFLNDWHPEKREKFRADELPTWLDWMRRHGIEPTGTGPKTATGRLFA